MCVHSIHFFLPLEWNSQESQDAAAAGVGGNSGRWNILASLSLAVWVEKIENLYRKSPCLEQNLKPIFDKQIPESFPPPIA